MIAKSSFVESWRDITVAQPIYQDIASQHQISQKPFVLDAPHFDIDGRWALLEKAENR